MFINYLLQVRFFEGFADIVRNNRDEDLIDCGKQMNLEIINVFFNSGCFKGKIKCKSIGQERVNSWLDV